MISIRNCKTPVRHGADDILKAAEGNDSEMFSLRIVSADHYMAEPCPGLDVVYSEFRATKIFKLPVIRLYGPTRLGE